LELGSVTAHGPTTGFRTDHALVKAPLHGISRSDVEDAVLGGHDRRVRNARAADWFVQSGRLVVAYTIRKVTNSRRWWSHSGDGTSMRPVEIDGHYDTNADIAWLRFEDYDPNVVTSEETDFGLRELDPSDRHVVGLEYWQASSRLPSYLIGMLPSPPVGVADPFA
jgi:uncharacterized protein YuzE